MTDDLKKLLAAARWLYGWGVTAVHTARVFFLLFLVMASWIACDPELAKVYEAHPLAFWVLLPLGVFAASWVETFLSPAQGPRGPEGSPFP